MVKSVDTNGIIIKEFNLGGFETEFSISAIRSHLNNKRPKALYNKFYIENIEAVILIETIFTGLRKNFNDVSLTDVIEFKTDNVIAVRMPDINTFDS